MSLPLPSFDTDPIFEPPISSSSFPTPIDNSPTVFKLKLHPDGSIARYKARLVAKGYNQIEGVDFFDNISLVAKSITVRIFLGIVVARSWPLFKLVINNAFLHEYLDEEVYMDPPEGYTAAQPG
ncbi:UNVERIFIED_CONTAM: Retrovirus-related Pol polyprotein from transposon RE2 [Sesamum radiatum]|uniref:Retrovirus-related Pol polyprotein from transposon RE2 n=1 Tax=Sesamum radiatum TaxID=300843 RepID=A0AAW2V7C1_SESRA